MEDKKTKILLWSPRVAAFIFAAVLMVFSYKVIPPGMRMMELVISVKDYIAGFLSESTSAVSLNPFVVELLKQNIPAFIIIAIIVISWNYEKTAGIAFVLVGFVHMIKSVLDHDRLGITWYAALALSLLVAVPAIAIGALYLVNWSKRKETMPVEVYEELQEDENEEDNKELDEDVEQ